MNFRDLNVGDFFIPSPPFMNKNSAQPLCKKVETIKEAGQNTVSPNGQLHVTLENETVIRVIV